MRQEAGGTTATWDEGRVGLEGHGKSATSATWDRDRGTRGVYKKSIIAKRGETVFNSCLFRFWEDDLFWSNCLRESGRENRLLKDVLFTRHAQYRNFSLFELSKYMFEIYPGSFESFSAIYGWDHKVNKPQPLYDVGCEHVHLFERLEIPDTLHFQKMIRIAINGNWDADAVTCFQMMIDRKLRQRTDLMLHLLDNLSDIELKSFWFFFFDGPHPDRQIDDAISQAAANYPRVARLMNRAFKDVRSQPYR